MTNAARLPFAMTAPRCREHLYYPSAHGHFFAAARTAERTIQLPFHGIIALTRDGAPLKITSGGRTIEGAAFAICARDVQLGECAGALLILINPLHENFRSFSRIPEPGVMPLDRAIFHGLESAVNRALDGALTHEEGIALFESVQCLVRSQLPSAPKLDERTQILIEELRANPRCSVTELAQRLGLSYHRTSHLFTESVGIAMRTYQLWQKLYCAGARLLSGSSLTQAAYAAGFVDSAHYSGAFQKAYGRPPSGVFRNAHVTVCASDPVSRARQANATIADR